MTDVSVFNFEQEGQEAQVVLEWSGSASLQALATSCADTFWPAFRGRTAGDCTLTTIQVGDSVNGVTEVVNEAGQGPGAASPVTNAILIAKSVFAGHNGRFFWPGLGESDVDAAGRLSASALSAWQTAADTAFNTMAIAGHDMYVTGSDSVERPVTGLSVRPYIGTQRRRLFN